MLFGERPQFRKPHRAAVDTEYFNEHSRLAEPCQPREVDSGFRVSGTAQHNAYIGAITNHANATVYKLFNGLIDDVRVYTRALSSAEILWLAGQTAPVAKPF